MASVMEGKSERVLYKDILSKNAYVSTNKTQGHLWKAHVNYTFEKKEVVNVSNRIVFM